MIDTVWNDVCELVRRHVGITLPPTMRDVVQRSLGELGVVDPGRELARPALLERFLDRLFLGTSWFDRERAGIDALVQALIPVAQRRSDRSVVVWSAGCAAGQEPFAITMALVEAGLHPRVTATDFHRPSLDVAREARYSAKACAKLPAAWRDKYVEIVADGSGRVRDTIRSRIRFQQHNFAIEPAIVSQVDAVVCRNVLIYFERTDALAMIARLAGACREGGLLLVGAVEAPLLWMSASDPRFGGGAVPLVTVSRGSPLRAPAVAPASNRQRTRLVEMPTAPTTLAALAKARSLERAGQLDAALRVLDVPVATAPLDAPAHLARGLLFKQQGDLPAAIRALRAARFLDPTAWLAPYQLALCLERVGETDEAIEAYRHTVATISEGGSSGVYPRDEAIEMLATTTRDAARAKLRVERARTHPGFP